MKVLKIQGLALSLGFFAAVCAQAQTNSPRTVTNADLEKYRQARVKAEEDYRQNYERLGRPSPEELERREAERQKSLTAYSLQLQEQRRQNEYSYQTRAGVLRSEIASVEAQIAYLSSQTNYQSNQNTYYSFGYAPFAFRAAAPNRGSGTVVGPNTQMVRDQAAMFPNTASIRAQISGNIGRGVSRGNFARPIRRGGYYAPLAIGGGNFTQGELTSRLQYLLQLRAGLWAQWNVLEDEARRNGVSIY
jgi:hypothetical protein